MKKISTSNLLQKLQEESLCKKQGLNLKEQKGITLIALVVTIVVLLILAGVTITMVLGEGGILDMAKEAADRTNNAIANEQSDIAELTNQLENILNGGGSGSGSGGASQSTTPEELKVGSTVTYNPSGTYNWKAKYCSSTKDETTVGVTLNSASGQNFNISSWKVLSIEGETVELVPSAPTTGTVYLGEAQGYNNAVKLLNEACSALYGRTDRTITARSISMEDIEKYMTENAKNSAHASPYDTQPYDAYTANRWYPAIYAQENKAVIDKETKTNGLGMSDTPNDFIERTASVGDTTAENGKIQATTSIQPYHTYWKKDENSMKAAFESYDDNGGNYYNLIIPKGSSTTYWVASRCVYAWSNYSNFVVRSVSSGSMDAAAMFSSHGYPANYSNALFPVVSLSSGLIKSNGDKNFKVELNQ